MLLTANSSDILGEGYPASMLRRRERWPWVKTSLCRRKRKKCHTIKPTVDKFIQVDTERRNRIIRKSGMPSFHDPVTASLCTAWDSRTLLLLEFFYLSIIYTFRELFETYKLGVQTWQSITHVIQLIGSGCPFELYDWRLTPPGQVEG